jgi:hypothetical protein
MWSWSSVKALKKLLWGPCASKIGCNEVVFGWNVTVVVHGVDNVSKVTKIVEGAIRGRTMTVAKDKNHQAKKTKNIKTPRTQHTNQARFRPASLSIYHREQLRQPLRLPSVNWKNHSREYLSANNPGSHDSNQIEAGRPTEIPVDVD